MVNEILLDKNITQEWPSIKDLGEKATTDALSLFGGWSFYFAEVVDRYLVFPQVRALFLAASIWLVTTDLFIKTYKEKKSYFLNIRNYYLKLPIALTLIWIILSLITFICGISVYQKLDSLDMDTDGFFIPFIQFMGVSYIISIILRKIIRRMNKYSERVIVRRRD